MPTFEGEWRHLNSSLKESFLTEEEVKDVTSFIESLEGKPTTKTETSKNIPSSTQSVEGSTV